MPANVAHMLICNKAVKVLQDGGEYQQFIDILDSKIYKPFLNLGSVGPDLSYYGSQISNWGPVHIRAKWSLTGQKGFIIMNTNLN
jgi:hypothetical protein